MYGPCKLTSYDPATDPTSARTVSDTVGCTELRAVNVPARLVSVYAPGAYPMDFHAVAEAFVEGHWRVVDATLLAPRQTLVRIATGRDASDTAFLDNHKGAITLNQLMVSAIVDGDLPRDSIDELVSIR